VPRRLGLSVAPRFLWECLTNPAVSPSPTPATSNGASGFPALRFPARFTSRVMRPTRAAALSVATLGRCRLHLVRPDQPSPWRISPAAGLADQWVLLSGHPCLPCCRRSYGQQGPFAPRALPRFHATTSPSATLSSSADFPVVPVIRPTQLPLLSPRDEEGFSSCSVRPGRRAVANHPAGAAHRVNRSAASRTAFALTVAGSAPGSTHFRGHLAFTCVTARRLAPLPRRGLSRGFRFVGFPSACPPSYGASDCYPGGFDSR
jgi:hypothetical protein